MGTSDTIKYNLENTAGNIKMLGERVEKLKALVMFSLIFPFERYSLERKKNSESEEIVLQMVQMGKALDSLMVFP